MAAVEDERVVGRSSVQLNPDREVTPKAVSKTKSNSERRYGYVLSYVILAMNVTSRVLAVMRVCSVGQVVKGPFVDVGV